jgi:formate hydrogenlyase subunit 4
MLCDRPIPLLVALLLAPLLLGVINRTKALFAGRRGQPLLQAYFDLAKLLRKGATYSHTTTWVFRAGPALGLAAVVGALAVAPLGGMPAAVAFQGDLLLFAYLLALQRFLTVIAALDTGSSFEGMGASREVLFSALAEPALFLALVALVRQTGTASLSALVSGVEGQTWLLQGPALGLIAVALSIVLLAENSRIPVDDPNTHLELTMIHEVMVLDHSGPDFAFILYAAALKLWLLGSLLAGLVLPVRSGNRWADGAVALAGVGLVGVVVGIAESTLARLRLVRVPKLLVGATALAAVAVVLVLR